ncbi:MAG: hypothetical protein ACK41F_01980 [Fimbriimonadaceae bacterium]
MAAVVASALMLALGAVFYALGLFQASRGSFAAELRVTLDVLRDGAWSPSETLTIASRRALDERGALRWIVHRGSTIFRLATGAEISELSSPDQARVRCELEARDSGGRTLVLLQFLWPSRSDGAAAQDAELLLERIAAEVC